MLLGQLKSLFTLIFSAFLGWCITNTFDGICVGICFENVICGVFGMVYAVVLLSIAIKKEKENREMKKMFEKYLDWI